MTSTGPGAPGTSPKPTDDTTVVQSPTRAAGVIAAALPSTGRRARAGHVTSYGPGRPCSTVGCTTPLSIYNSGESCSLHSRRIGRGEQVTGPADLPKGPDHAST